MIIKDKQGNTIATGKVTKKGSSLDTIGKNNTLKYSFSICANNKKDESGEWQSTFLECAVIGKDAASYPTLYGGEKVIIGGQTQVREWQGRDGDMKKSETLICDFISFQNTGGGSLAQDEIAAAPPFKPVFVQVDEDEVDPLPF